jgi:hypothetical protein
LPLAAPAPYTSSSASWAACHPVLAVMATRTYRADPAGKLIVTALPLAGLNVWTAEPLRLVNDEPVVLPCTDSVWLRDPQPVGSFSTTWSTLVAVPRSTCAHCGKALFALSQYVFGLPSVRFAGR